MIYRAIPKKIHPLGVTLSAFAFGLWGFGNIFDSLISNKISAIIQSEGAVPLWKNSNNVANVDRLFFSLDDAKNNEINILHDGLYTFILI